MSEKSKVVIIGGEPSLNQQIIEALTGKGVDLVLIAKDGDSLLEGLKANGLLSFVSGGFTADIGKPSGQADDGRFVLGESICDPLQEAINSTEIACRDAPCETLNIMQEHLKHLLRLQLANELRSSEMSIEDIYPSSEVINVKLADGMTEDQKIEFLASKGWNMNAGRARC